MCIFYTFVYYVFLHILGITQTQASSFICSVYSEKYWDPVVPGVPHV